MKYHENDVVQSKNEIQVIDHSTFETATIEPNTPGVVVRTVEKTIAGKPYEGVGVKFENVNEVVFLFADNIETKLEPLA